jgi:hypothetical protein
VAAQRGLSTPEVSSAAVTAKRTVRVPSSAKSTRAVPVSCSVVPVAQSGKSRPARGSATRFPRVRNMALPA